MYKLKRDNEIKEQLKKFKVLSRDHLIRMIFNENANPVNVCNRVLKRLTLNQEVLQIPRTKDQCYLYTLNPSPIHHRSNKMDHHLSIVDFYLAIGKPTHFDIEPSFGSYNPDIHYTDKQNRKVFVEIQRTPISKSKMQQKINQFANEYKRTHNTTILLIISDYPYKNIKCPQNLNIFQKHFPNTKII